MQLYCTYDNNTHVPYQGFIWGREVHLPPPWILSAPLGYEKSTLIKAKVPPHILKTLLRLPLPECLDETLLMIAYYTPTDGFTAYNASL